MAVGSLASEPPSWLTAKISQQDWTLIDSAVPARRRRELLWSRGLKAALISDAPPSEALAQCHAPTISIAHDHHCVAVALSWVGGVGIDVQSARSLKACHQIAQTWFPAKEAAEIVAAQSSERFLQSWVIKEAWAKCMNRSIWVACQTIAVWQDRVHRTVGGGESLQFAWTLSFAESLGLTPLPQAARAIGICFNAKQHSAPAIKIIKIIKCSAPTENAGLQPGVVDWQWLTVAA